MHTWLDFRINFQTESELHILSPHLLDWNSSIDVFTSSMTRRNDYSDQDNFQYTCGHVNSILKVII